MTDNKYTEIQKREFAIAELEKVYDEMYTISDQLIANKMFTYIRLGSMSQILNNHLSKLKEEIKENWTDIEADKGE